MTHTLHWDQRLISERIGREASGPAQNLPTAVDFGFDLSEQNTLITLGATERPVSGGVS